MSDIEKIELWIRRRIGKLRDDQSKLKPSQDFWHVLEDRINELDRVADDLATGDWRKDE